MHSYYNLDRVSVIANAHCINIVLNVPLKLANIFFLRINALPTHVAFVKFFLY